MWLDIFSKVEVFFKEIKLDDTLGKKTKYYAIRIILQERGSSHVHSFIWNFYAENIKNESGYIEFIEKTVNGQVHAHSRTCWKYSNNEYCVSMINILQLLQSRLILNLAMIKNGLQHRKIHY